MSDEPACDVPEGAAAVGPGADGTRWMDKRPPSPRREALRLAPRVAGALYVLVLAALVAALLIAVTLFARSLKEAQSYVAPLGLILVLPVVGLQFSDFLPQSPLLYGLPAFGTLLLLNDTVRGDFDLRLAAWAWGSSLLLAALLLGFALRSFRREDVLFRT